MEKLHFCQSSGMLVGADYTIPEDPSVYSDYTQNIDSALWGCNNLTCTTCGARVRNAAHVSTRNGFEKLLTKIYETPDWSTIPELVSVPDYAGRLYLCRCDAWIECHWTLLDDKDHDLFYTPLPWKCAGHPIK